MWLPIINRTGRGRPSPWDSSSSS